MSFTISDFNRIISNSTKLTKDFVKLIRYYGHNRYCPICEKYSRSFFPAGIKKRKDARCIHCGSLERHRFLWLFLSKKTNLFDERPKNVLHIAPKSFLKKRFEKFLGNGYITADLYKSNVMVKMDITDIQYHDQSFSVIICSHVLEHVQDDKKAIRECYRVLNNNGWAIFVVPVSANETFEDSSIIDPEERIKLFGKSDHVRKYGSDFVTRLTNAKFKVDIIEVSDLVDEENAALMGIFSAGKIFYCTK